MGLGRSAGTEQGAQRYVAVAQWNSGLVLTGDDRIGLEDREWEPQHLRHPPACGIQCGPQITGTQHQAGQVCCQVGFPPALLGLGGAQPGLPGENVGQQRHRQENEDRQRILRVRRYEAHAGVHVELDVDRRTGQRRGHSEPETPSCRDDQHADQEQHAEGVLWRDLLQSPYKKRLAGDENRGHDDAQPQRGRRRPHHEPQQSRGERWPGIVSRLRWRRGMLTHLASSTQNGPSIIACARQLCDSGDKCALGRGAAAGVPASGNAIIVDICEGENCVLPRVAICAV